MNAKTEITREHRCDKIELAVLWAIISIYNVCAAIGASTWSFTSNDWEFNTSGTGIIAYIALALSVFWAIKYLIEAIKRPVVDEEGKITVAINAVAMDEPKSASGYKFKVGDRVKTNSDITCQSLRYRDFTIFPLYKGSTGTVLEESRIPFIRWDVGIKGMYSCGRACEDGHGWAVDESDLELITDEEKSSSNT